MIGQVWVVGTETAQIFSTPELTSQNRIYDLDEGDLYFVVFVVSTQTNNGEVVRLQILSCRGLGWLVAHEDDTRVA